MFDSLARYHTVVVYDMRGAGLSERNRTVFTLESELQDLETVIDHLKLDKMILYGRGFSGPVVIAYAAKHPERVTHLILYGTYAYYGKYRFGGIHSVHNYHYSVSLIIGLVEGP